MDAVIGCAGRGHRRAWLAWRRHFSIAPWTYARAAPRAGPARRHRTGGQDASEDARTLPGAGRGALRPALPTDSDSQPRPAGRPARPAGRR